jgi:tight adherence protein B
VSWAPAVAALAAGLGVLGAWEAIVAAEQARLATSVGRLLRPLHAAGDGHAPTGPENRRLAFVGVGVLMAAGWMVAGPVAGCLLGAAGPWAAQLSVRSRRRRWQAAMVAGAPPTARALADALAGGHSLRGAVEEAAGGIEGAAGAQLRHAASALALGEPTGAVIEQLRRRAADPAWDTLAAAILLQRRAGGDLAALLRDLAGTLEDQQRVEADARGATVQARFTGFVVALLPAGVAVLALLARPQVLVGVARSPPAVALSILALVLIVLGLLAIRRISARVGR